VPYGFEPHCSSAASVDGASGREPFEFEHSLSIGGVVGVEREMSNLLIILVPGGGVEPPRPCGRRILSLILGILQGIALRRSKSQQASYLHTDTCMFEVAM
jgi:hypothetical protein